MNGKDTVPSVEIIKPLCTCGKEIGFLQYELVAKNDFDSFAKKYNLNKKPIFKNKNYIDELQLCCQLACRYPNSVTFSVFQIQKANRTFPFGLESPSGIMKKIEWYQ